MELSVEGYAEVDLSVTPSPVQNKFNVTFNFTITDQYGVPLPYFDYTLDFAGVYNKSGSSTSHKFSWTVLPDFIAGNYWLNMTLNGTYLLYTTFNYSIGVQGVVAASILAPAEGAAFTQGESIEFSVLVQDELFNNITGATVELRVGGEIYFLVEVSDGIYNGTFDATDLPIGEYLAQIIVSQAFMDTQQLARSISLTGDTIIDVAIPSTVLNFENATFQVTVTDLGYHPVNEFDYYMDLGGQYNNSGAATKYIQTWTLVPQLLPGSCVLNVTISGPRIPTKWVTTVVQIKSETNATVHVVLNGKGKIIGILTERDVLTDVVATGKSLKHMFVENIMTKNVIKIPSGTKIEEAAEIMKEEIHDEAARLKTMRDKLIREVLESVPKSYLNGHPEKRLPHNAHFRFDYIEG